MTVVSTQQSRSSEGTTARYSISFYFMFWILSLVVSSVTKKGHGLTSSCLVWIEGQALQNNVVRSCSPGAAASV